MGELLHDGELNLRPSSTDLTTHILTLNETQQWDSMREK